VARRGLGARRAAEVEVNRLEAVAAVGADLLQRREQLRLGLGPDQYARRHLLRRLDVDAAVALEARGRRDQLADDHVLLQAEQPIGLALDRRVRQHLRRLLEGRGGEEGLGRERRLRDPEDQRFERRLLALLLLDARVLTLQDDLVDELSGQELRRAGVLDAYLLQHLPDDQLDVLVVDVHALRLVDLLHLGDEVQLGRSRAAVRLRVQLEQLGRRDRAVRERVALFDTIALLDEQPRAAGEEVLPLLGLVVLLGALAEEVDLDAAAVRVADGHRARDLGKLRGALRVPRLEDLDDARQAVGDVGTRDASGVERPHRQLRARLADRLRGHDPDRVADLAELARAEERAVARAADAHFA